MIDPIKLIETDAQHHFYMRCLTLVLTPQAAATPNDYGPLVIKRIRVALVADNVMTNTHTHVHAQPGTNMTDEKNNNALNQC